MKSWIFAAWCYLAVWGAMLPAQSRTHRNTKPQEVRKLLETIATSGGFSVAVDARIGGETNVDVKNVEPAAALRRVAAANHLFVIPVPYIKSTTYFISPTPDVALPPPVESSAATIWTFTTPRDTEALWLAYAASVMGKFELQQDLTFRQKLAFNVKATALQALHLIAAMTGRQVEARTAGGSRSYALLPRGLPAVPRPRAAPLDTASDFRINLIAGLHPNYLAVIEYGKFAYMVQAGTKVPDVQHPDFTVNTITPRLLEITETRSGRRVQKFPYGNAAR